MTMRSTRGPEYVYTESQVREKSERAKAFLIGREEGNSAVDKADNSLVKRFYNVDHNAYLDGALTAQQKELMGLVGSIVLRCDDCVYYHVIQAYRLGAEKQMQMEAMNIGMVIGGTITIPHMRRAYLLLDELYAES